MKKLGLAIALVVTILAGSAFAAPVQNSNSAPAAGNSNGMKHHRRHHRRRHHRRGRRAAANANT
jgi:Ni/Co efflux regulator RcnB